MIYKVAFKEVGRTGTWEIKHFRAKDFPTLISKKINPYLEKYRIKLTVKSIEETDLRVS